MTIIWHQRFTLASVPPRSALPADRAQSDSSYCPHRLRRTPGRRSSRNKFPHLSSLRRNLAPSHSPLKLNLLVLKLSRQLHPAFKQTPSDSSEDKAADVRKVRHPARLNLRNRACVEELCEEPKANQERGRDERDPPKNEDKQNSANFISRISDQECAH